MSRSRFDYTEFSKRQADYHTAVRLMFEKLEAFLALLPDSRPKSLALTKLEESFMWVGKAVRDWPPGGTE